MIKRKKRGFTIVELVIVIAVIGILSAVLIPIFSGLVEKANLAADNVLVDSINKQLKIAEVEDGKNTTMYDALLDAKEAGYLVGKINARSKNTLVWDQEADRFALLDSENQVIAGESRNANKKVKLWKIYSEVPTLASQEYSIYYSGSDVIESQKVKVGFDAGDGEVQSLEYSNSVLQDVIIRTNSAGTNLSISDSSMGSIYHYGDAGALEIIQCHTGSFHENGKVAYVEIAKGRIVLESGSSVEEIHINKKTVSSFDTVIIANNGGSQELPERITRDVVTVEEETLVVKVESNGSSENVYVYASGTVGTTEKITEGANKQNENVSSSLGQLVLDNGGSAGEKAQTDEQKEAARENTVEEAKSEEVQTEDNEYVARIGKVGYSTLKAAANAAGQDDVIYLLKDFDIDSNIGSLGGSQGIKNKVVLTKDIAITFVGAYKINLSEGGEIAVNGHRLTLQTDADLTSPSSCVNYYNAGLFGIKASDAGSQMSVLESIMSLSQQKAVISGNLYYSSHVYYVAFDNLKESTYQWRVSGYPSGRFAPINDTPAEDVIVLYVGGSTNIGEEYPGLSEFLGNYEFDEMEIVSPEDDDMISVDVDWDGITITAQDIPGNVTLTFMLDEETFDIPVVIKAANSQDVFQVGENKYGSLAAAIAAVNNNEPIVLLQDFDLSATIYLYSGEWVNVGYNVGENEELLPIEELRNTKTFNLDLNGYVLTGRIEITDISLTILDSVGTGRIEGEVNCAFGGNRREKLPQGDNDYDYFVTDPCIITFKGGTIDCIMLSDRAHVVIDGAKVINTEPYEQYFNEFAIGSISSLDDVVLIVKSGEVKGTYVDAICITPIVNNTIIIEGGSFSFDPTEFVDLSMYEVVHEGNVYSVVLKSE